MCMSLINPAIVAGFFFCSLMGKERTFHWHLASVAREMIERFFLGEKRLNNRERKLTGQTAIHYNSNTFML